MKSNIKSNMQKKYITTDMAVERITEWNTTEKSGENRENCYAVSEESINGFHIHRLTVTRPCAGITEAGKYITVTLGQPWLEAANRTEKAAEAVAEIIRELCQTSVNGIEKIQKRTIPDRQKKNSTKEPSCTSPVRSALILCLGNAKITADAVGPLCADGIIATRHLRNDRPDIWREIGEIDLSCITPGVSGNTGFDALEIAKATVKTAKPQVVIAIDALAARDTARLGASVQISDAGIAPGSGIGNRRAAISEETLGVPVISLGVPTVAHSVTLLRDALERAGIREENALLESALDVGRDLLVTPKDCDMAIASISDILARAVNLAFLGFQRI